MLLLSPFTLDFTTIDLRVVLAALAIIVAVALAFYFQWWRNRKRLSYEVLSDVELVSSEKIRDKIEIRYEGKPVESVHLVVVKLINDGYQPIKKDEFEKPIRFVFQGGTILSAEKEKFQPENMGTEVSYQDRFVEIAPTLFNHKDYIQFKVLLNGFSKLEIDTRIVGISNLGRTKKLWNTAYVNFLIGLVGGAVFPLLALFEDLSVRLLTIGSYMILIGIAIISTSRHKS